MQGRLVVYVAASDGAGKTRRLNSDALHYQAAGKDVVALDDLHLTWQRALELRETGKNVIGAFNIEHLETVSAQAGALLGKEIHDTVPLTFLKAADEVIALDAPPDLIVRRMKGAAPGEDTLKALRQMLLRTIDDLTMPSVSAEKTSTAVALISAGLDAHQFLVRATPIASALDLAIEILPDQGVDVATVEHEAGEHNAEVLPAQSFARLDAGRLKASLIILANGKLAEKIVNAPVDRDIFVADATQSFIGRTAHTTPLSGTLGDRMRVGYGKLTVYLAAAAGAGKTYAMLGRGVQLKGDGADVAIGLLEAPDRTELAAMIAALPEIPRKHYYLNGMTYAELDREAILERRPQVVLIDDLAHVNAPMSLAPKRYLDVLALLRAGINVVTTLNVQHLDALSDVVYRLTGSTEPETLPDGILPLAGDVILVDVTPETLRERGNKLPLATLAALRELAIRETLRAKTRERIDAPFQRLLVSAVARPDDLLVVRKASRLAARLEVDFAVAHIAEPKDHVDAEQLEELRHFAQVGNAEWIEERANDAAVRLLEVARLRPETVVAVGGTHRQPRWPARNAFARRMLDAGARELIVLARPK